MDKRDMIIALLLGIFFVVPTEFETPFQAIIGAAIIAVGAAFALSETKRKPHNS